LIAVIVEDLARPPDGCANAMALVIGTGGADHLGLLAAGALAPGALDLLASAISARARPHATLLLEWSCADASAHSTLGWAVERLAALVVWRRLSADALDAVIDPRTRRPLGARAPA
jgi:hypothetical protein